MPDFVPVKALKKEPLRASCAIDCAQHCPMDILLEELHEMGDVDVLVVGVGECAYYSRKMPFSGGRRNWAYQLEDREIIFGELSGLDAALARLAEDNRAAVCISTCVPSIMHLAVPELIARKYPSVACVEAPSFQGISPTDSLETLYCALLAGAPAGQDAGVAVWDEAPAGLAALRERLRAGVHIVRSRRFLGLLRERERAGAGVWLDDYSFHPLDWYARHAQTLRLPGGTLEAMDVLTRALAARGPLALRGPFAYEFALYLCHAGAQVRRVSFGDFHRYAYERCLKLPEGILVCPENGALEAVPGETALDFTPDSEEIARLRGSGRLLFLLRRAEEICH